MARSKKARSAAARRARSQRPKESQERAVDFASEYRYVLNDLKHVGLLAAAMFAVLAMLALVLP